MGSNKLIHPPRVHQLQRDRGAGPQAGHGHLRTISVLANRRRSRYGAPLRS